MGFAAIGILSIAVAVTLVMPCGATQYMVGDSTGWDTATNLKSWVQGKSFGVGDTLNFQYSSQHSVLEVRKSDYDSCQTGNALQSFSDGNTQIPLSNPGNMYFICGTLGHCAGGMKMAIDVQSSVANGGSPASTTGSPPASAFPSTPVPATSPNYNSPHAQSSASTSINVGVSGAIVIVAGLSLFI